MKRLWILITVFFLTVALAASLGVGQAGAIAPDPEAESRVERRTQDADFVRHNHGMHVSAVSADTKARWASGHRTQDIDFLRHNYDCQLVSANVEAIYQHKMQVIDFLRHNCDSGLWAIGFNVDQLTQTQSDPQPFAHPRNKR